MRWNSRRPARRWACVDCCGGTHIRTSSWALRCCRARAAAVHFEAAAATLEFAFSELHLKRIVAITAPHNDASMHILQRLGMRPEGRVHFTADGESQLFGIER